MNIRRTSYSLDPFFIGLIAFFLFSYRINFLPLINTENAGKQPKSYFAKAEIDILQLLEMIPNYIDTFSNSDNAIRLEGTRNRQRDNVMPFLPLLK